jgi:hypothetical protein
MQRKMQNTILIFNITYAKPVDFPISSNEALTIKETPTPIQAPIKEHIKCRQQ